MPVRCVGELVPRADGKAIVAAIDAVAERAAKLLGYRPLVFDGEVGNAPAGIELVWRGEGIGRARILAGTTLAAAVGMGCVRFEAERRVDRAEEKPAAVAPADQIGVLALPTDSGGLAKRLLHHRRGIDEDLELARGFAFDQPARERLERLLDHIVIVAPLRINRNARLLRVLCKCQRIDIGRIAHAQRNDAAGFGPEPLRRSALGLAGLHPFH